MHECNYLHFTPRLNESAQQSHCQLGMLTQVTVLLINSLGQKIATNLVVQDYPMKNKPHLIAACVSLARLMATQPTKIKKPKLT